MAEEINQDSWIRGNPSELSEEILIYQEIMTYIVSRSTTKEGNRIMNKNINRCIEKFKTCAESMNYSFWNSFNLQLLDINNLMLLHGMDYDSNSDEFKKKLFDLIQYRIHYNMQFTHLEGLTIPTIENKPAHVSEIIQSDTFGDAFGVAAPKAAESAADSAADSTAESAADSAAESLSPVMVYGSVKTSNNPNPKIPNPKIPKPKSSKPRKTKNNGWFYTAVSVAPIALIGGLFIYKKYS